MVGHSVCLSNGNQTSRRVGGITYTLIYDAENRLVQIKRGSTTQATYTYDGDGNRVKTVVGSTTTAFVGNFLEWTGSTTTMKKYYYAGGQRVAMRQGSSTLYYLLTDHLGSTSITATSAGGFYTELRYYPWGGTRYASGTTPTSFRYTGQREAEVGLYYYGARFYDAQLGRFVSPDTISPNPRHPLSFDRFAYVQNNPIKYTDPTGHWSCGDQYDPACAENDEELFDYNFYLYMVRLVGINSATERASIRGAVRDIAYAFAAEAGTDDYLNLFLDMYNGPVTFQRVEESNNAWGETVGTTISIFSGTPTGGGIEYRNFIVHEMGHAFDKAHNLGATSALQTFSYFGDADAPTAREGFASPDDLWIQGNHTYYQDRGDVEGNYRDVSEQFADTFLGWVYGEFAEGDAGDRRSAWADTYMHDALTVTSP